MAHEQHVPADFASTFRHRFASLFGRKIARQRSEQYLGGLLCGRAERRNVTSLAGTVDGATARALGWLLNKSPWPTRPIVDALQTYVGETLGSPEGLFTLNLDSFVKRGDNAVGVEKQYVHHLGRTLNCQIGVFLAYGAGQGSSLVDAALYMPHAWIDSAPRRHKAGVPESVEYQPKSALAVSLLREARAAGRLPGAWVTSWHGEGFEADLRARLDAEGWRYLLPVSAETPFFASPEASETLPASAILADESGAELTLRRVWEPTEDARQAIWLLGCTDELTGNPAAFVSNAPEGEALETFTRIVAARWDTARMLAARCAGVSLDVYRVRGWDGWHRHVALALLASAFRACLPSLPTAAAASAPRVAVRVAPVAPVAPAEPEMPAPSLVLIPTEEALVDPTPVALAPADQVIEDIVASSEQPAFEGDPNAILSASDIEKLFGGEPAVEAEPVAEAAPVEGAPVPVAVPAVAGPTTYRLLVDLAESDWRAVRAFQIWLVADEAGTVLSSSPTRSEIERQEVGSHMEVRFTSEHSLEQILAALDEVPEIVVSELAPEGAVAADVQGEAVALDDTEDLLAALQAELAERTTAREAGLMPAFEGVAEVVGNAVTEASIVLEEVRDLVTAQALNGSANGHTNGNGNGSAVATKGSLATPVAPPMVPPTESPVRPSGQPSTAPAGAAAPAAKADESSKKSEEKARPAEEQMVVLDVGDESYGIPVQRVREIIRVPPITRVPNGPAFLEGVINLRGQVIPVMDLRKHLGIPTGDETRSSRVVVSELGRHTVGLMVDGVSEVVMVSVADIEPPPSLIAGANDGQVCGVARLGDRLVLFLDPDRVLPNR